MQWRSATATGAIRWSFWVYRLDTGVWSQKGGLEWAGGSGDTVRSGTFAWIPQAAVQYILELRLLRKLQTAPNWYNTQVDSDTILIFVAP